METHQLDLFTEIISDTEHEVIPFRYEMTSYGADYPIKSLVKRLRNGDILVPPFLRRYVWNKLEASKFIESLLLGLPIPGIFLSKESENNKLLIVDGQQRLLTLLYFYDKQFKDGSDFRLLEVQEDLEGKDYDDLSPADKDRLDDSIIHATIIKQNEPGDDDSSIYQVFERINSGGLPLSPQEIRAYIYSGKYNDLLVDLATTNASWRNIIGGEHNERLKEEELILRYFSLLLNLDAYKKPMKEFLNVSMANNRDLSIHSEETLRGYFQPTVDFISEALGDKAFRVQRGVHSAVFDAVMIATTKKLTSGGIASVEAYVKAYDELLEDSQFKKYYTSGTTDEKTIEQRIQIATQKIAALK